MAYKKADLEMQAIEVINENKLLFVEDVVAYLPCSRSTFYAKKLDKSDTIKEALETNRISTKNGLRRKWFEGGNATTQIALYKLLATPEELKRLASQYIDHSTQGESLNKITIEISGGRKPAVTKEHDVRDISAEDWPSENGHH